MKVKVHPHKTLVNSGVEACVSITPDKKHGRAYYMGTAMLENVSFRIHSSGVERARKEKQRNVHAWAVGNLTWELPEQYRPADNIMKMFTQVTYHYEIGRFVTMDGIDVSDKTFKAAVFIGRDFYVTTKDI